MCSPALTLAVPADVLRPLYISSHLAPWYEYLLSLPLLTQRWLLTPFSKDDMLLTGQQMDRVF